MDDSDDSLATVTSILEKLTQAQPQTIDLDSDLQMTGILSSLTSMNLILELERIYRIRIPNSELNRLNFSTIRSIAEMVTKIRDT